ncbi:bifunctional oligoribonuclease/PAP phosphatase NrnA [Patescibacteria group bacterium]
MKSFLKEFNTLRYIIKKSNRILLFAHSRPDGDATGSNLAMKYYLESIGKKADVGCFDSFPGYLSGLFKGEKFLHPDEIDFSSYDAVIACDSVARGFDKIKNKLSDNQAVVLIDHHPDIAIEGDLNIVESKYSSASEIVYDYFNFAKVKISTRVANFLLTGILGDTGNLQHANTTAKVMQAVADLIKRGASVSKIVNTIFTNSKISTLKLWGIAFEKAKINPKNKMIVTVITQEDLKKCGATYDDIADVASILNTVPETKFSLVLSQRGKTIKGSLRSEEYKGMNVSEVAHMFGGGGHRLASGFEVEGEIVEREDTWEIV